MGSAYMASHDRRGAGRKAMTDDSDDDRLYMSCINPITMSAALGAWLILGGIVMLLYALATV